MSMPKKELEKTLQRRKSATGQALQDMAEQAASGQPAASTASPKPAADDGAKAAAGEAAKAAVQGAASGAATAAAARKTYDAALKALEDGDLKKVPPAAPSGVETAHAAVGTAHRALPPDPKTVEECAAATTALETLEAKVKAYLEAEAKALAAAKKKYADEKLALENGDLKKVPASAPPGLETPYAAVQTAKSALPADPKTLDDYRKGSKVLAKLAVEVGAYLKAAAKKKNVDTGVATFGSTGSKLTELTGHATLNTEQKRILDEALKSKFAESDAELTEPQLKALAQVIVTKTNKLAETSLESDIPGINGALAKSETLKTNIVKLQQAGWTIVRNTPGGGSYCDKGNTTIAIDPDDPLDEALGGLAHETGHALFTPPPKPTVGGAASGVEYVRKATEVDFIDEGEAQLVACRTAKDLKAKNVQANVPADGGEFMAIYDKVVAGQLTEDAARKEMAKLFGNLVTSTTNESYLVYYGRAHIQTWNAAHPVPAQQLDESILASMTLFP